MDLIKVINEFSNVGVVVILQVLVYAYIGVKATQEIYKWFLGLFNAYSDKRSQDQQDEETLASVSKDREYFNSEIKAIKENQAHTSIIIGQLQASDTIMKEQLNLITNSIQNLSSMIEEDRNQTRISNVATIRAQLLNIAEKAEREGSITLADLETFDDLQKLYLEKGGNSHFKHAIIPKYFQYPVRDLNGLIAHDVIKSIHDKELYGET